jgi:hypothetical protein
MEMKVEVNVGMGLEVGSEVGTVTELQHAGKGVRCEGGVGNGGPGHKVDVEVVVVDASVESQHSWSFTG